ncbi:hypothetical protein, partial [Salmonella enterica]|uniref:hypothetical protein n=1 Tax=Salmonella enterica TaxID=28901 RepID=UPI0021B249DA
NHKKNIQISIYNFCFEVLIQRNKTEQLKKIRRSEVEKDCHVLDRELVGRAMYGKERNTVIDMSRNIDSQ